MNYLKRITLIALAIWLVLVSANMFRYSNPDFITKESSEIGRVFVLENPNPTITFISTKISQIEFYKDTDFFLQLLFFKTSSSIKVERFECFLYESFCNFKERLYTKIDLRDFMRIFPFHFYF
jgi:hypothetical protein